MNLTIELPDELGAVLEAQARAEGVSADLYVSRMLERMLTSENEVEPGKSFETGYGMWAKYGRAPSAEEINENRREMFENFAQGF